jgi:hypothetical protein
MVKKAGNCEERELCERTKVWVKQEIVGENKDMEKAENHEKTIVREETVKED